MEKVSDERIRRFAERIMSRQPGYDEAASMATELLLAGAVVEAYRKLRRVCPAGTSDAITIAERGKCDEAVAALDAAFTAPAPPADPTAGHRADGLRIGFDLEDDERDAIAVAIMEAEQAAVARARKDG